MQINSDKEHFDIKQIMNLLEQTRTAKLPKSTIEQTAEAIGISTSSYKRCLSGESDSLAKTLEIAYQICIYTHSLLFQLTKDQIRNSDTDYLQVLSSVEKLTKLNASNLEIIDSLIKAFLYSDEEQQHLIFSRAGFLEATLSICSFYYKILKVDLSTKIYSPIYIINSEWDDLPVEKTYNIENWIHYSVAQNLIHPDDAEMFLEKTNIYAMKTLMRFTNHDSSLRYRRKVANEYKTVRMELIKCNDYSPEHQNVILCIRDDFISDPL